jgi:hypothetical protein
MAEIRNRISESRTFTNLKNFEAQSDALAEVIRHFNSYEPEFLIGKCDTLLARYNQLGIQNVLMVLKLYAFLNMNLQPAHILELKSVLLNSGIDISVISMKSEISKLFLSGVNKMSDIQAAFAWSGIVDLIDSENIKKLFINKTNSITRKSISRAERLSQLSGIIKILRKENALEIRILDFICIKAMKIIKNAQNIEEYSEELNEFQVAIKDIDADSFIIKQFLNAYEIREGSELKFVEKRPIFSYSKTIIWENLNKNEVSSLEKEFDYIQRHENENFIKINSFNQEKKHGAYVFTVNTEFYCRSLYDELYKRWSKCCYFNTDEWNKVLPMLRSAKTYLTNNDLNSELKTEHFLITPVGQLKLFRVDLHKKDESQQENSALSEIWFLNSFTRKPK